MRDDLADATGERHGNRTPANFRKPPGEESGLGGSAENQDAMKSGHGVRGFGAALPSLGISPRAGQATSPVPGRHAGPVAWTAFRPPGFSNRMINHGRA